jgi:hypothetical protein
MAFNSIAASNWQISQHPLSTVVISKIIFDVTTKKSDRSQSKYRKES